MTTKVILSGGPKGGEIVDGKGWDQWKLKIIDGEGYRLNAMPDPIAVDDDGNTGAGQAGYVGSMG